LEPIYKWSGGKRKDIKFFKEYLPKYVINKEKYKFVEPFFGGGAVYWYLENNNSIINDVDIELINFLKTLKTNTDEISNIIDILSKNIEDITKIEKSKIISISDAKTQRGEFFYEWRNKDRNKGLVNLSNIDRAARFYIVNQLAFNGMRRFNSSGEFNVPYGNYKSFHKQWTKEHLELLNNTIINCGDYKNIIIDNDDENTFIFIDPPYTREFSEYSPENSFGVDKQVELSKIFKSASKCDIMIVINKDEFTTELYKDYITYEYDFKYATNIKNRYSNEVKHLVITNYK